MLDFASPLNMSAPPECRDRSGPSAPSAIRITLAATFGVLVWLGVGPKHANAWNFQEHTELGSDGYLAACDAIASEDAVAKIIADREKTLRPGEAICDHPTDVSLVRWCLACRTFTPALYGQAVAIAGDHVGTPAELMSTQGQQTAANLVDYTLLALVNSSHFHPEAPRAWKKYHEEALLWASDEHLPDVSDPDRLSLAHRFELAFYTSAFADHFLEDAFSAGHAGFNRPSSGAVASKAFHDAWNAAGRVVKSPAGDCWLQYGDNMLAAEKTTSPFGYRHIREAEKAAVYDVLVTFVTGERNIARETRPMYYMPIETTLDGLPGSIRGDPAVGGGPEVVEQAARHQRAGLTASGTGCTVTTTSIDGMSNPSRVNAGYDAWLNTSTGRDIVYGSIDLTYERHLFDFMQQPFYWTLGVTPLGWVSRDNTVGYAPGAIGGILAPPIYWLHGLARHDFGIQARGYLFSNGGNLHVDGYGSPLFRESLEVATIIVRLQAGPTFDFATGQVGVQATLGVEIARFRWITGGGSLVDF